MSYATDSTRRSGNNAVELIIFRTGPNSYIRTSTHTKELTIGGFVYEPYPFERGSRRISTAFDDDEVKIEVPPNHPITAHYRSLPTNYDVSVLVRQGFLNDNGTPRSNDMNADYPILVMGWIGAQEMDTETGKYTLSVVTLGDTLSAPSLTRYYQHSCPLRLYGPGCGATMQSINLLPISVANNRINLSLNWQGAQDMLDYVGGVVTFTRPDAAPEFRTVARAEAGYIVFLGSNLHLSDYSAVTLSLGCPHTLDGCRDMHDNSRRYGGFPWMPLENPTRKSIR